MDRAGLITYQSKIPLTALCSVWLLKRRLSLNQWISLAVLVAGMIMSNQSKSDDDVLVHLPLNSSLSPLNRMRRTSEEQLLASEGAQPSQRPLVGVLAFMVAAATSAFASVYFEKMIKSEGRPSLWLRNIQLAIYSTVIAAAGILINDDPLQAEHGLLHGESHPLPYRACSLMIFIRCSNHPHITYGNTIHQ